jgi:hypothetical protein
MDNGGAVDEASFVTHATGRQAAAGSAREGMQALPVDVHGSRNSFEAAGSRNSGDVEGARNSGEAVGYRNSGEATGVRNGGEVGGARNSGDATGAKTSGVLAHQMRDTLSRAAAQVRRAFMATNGMFSDQTCRELRLGKQWGLGWAMIGERDRCADTLSRAAAQVRRASWL